MNTDVWVTWLPNILTGKELLQQNPDQDLDSLRNPIEPFLIYRVGKLYPEERIVIFQVDDVNWWYNDVIFREQNRLN